MKKGLISLLAALLVAAVALPALSYDGFNARLDRIQNRINRLAGAGELYPRDTERFNIEVNRLRERAQYPDLSREERHRLERRIERLSDDIDDARRRYRENRERERSPLPFIPVPR
jgi:hypothetical protein